MTLAKRLTKAVERSGKTKSAIELEANLSGGSMTRLMSGERKAPGPEVIARLAKVLDVEYEYLATGKGEPEDVAQKQELAPAEAALEAFEWPAGFAPEEATAVVTQFREEAFRSSVPIPASYLRQRLRDLVAEALGRRKIMPTPGVDVGDDESPEIKAARKRPRRL